MSGTAHSRFPTIPLPENVGIPTGRNAGVPLVEDEFLFFSTTMLGCRMRARCGG
ncbi:MAG: hypothetical protein E6375_02940 [Dermabacter sp.]|nr:hypothetical protein [Dermabacter sp.]